MRLKLLAGKTLDYVNKKKAMEGTIEAHVTGEVPNIKITLEKLDAKTIGHLIYFFEKSLCYIRYDFRCKSI